MKHRCLTCGALLESRYCLRCGTDSRSIGPSLRTLPKIVTMRVDVRALGLGVLTVALGAGTFVFPYAGWLLAAGSLAALVWDYWRNDS
jgi:hypothetical protein